MEEILIAIQKMREEFDNDIDNFQVVTPDERVIVDEIRNKFHQRYENMILKFMEIIEHASRSEQVIEIDEDGHVSKPTLVNEGGKLRLKE